MAKPMEFRVPTATRITVVGKDGVSYERYKEFEHGALISIQDDGRTIKVLALPEE